MDFELALESETILEEFLRFIEQVTPRNKVYSEIFMLITLHDTRQRQFFQEYANSNIGSNIAQGNQPLLFSEVNDMKSLNDMETAKNFIVLVLTILELIRKNHETHFSDNLSIELSVIT